MSYDQGLAQRLREAVEERPGVTEKEMFGGLAFMLHDHMFVGIVNDDLMARVGPTAHDASLARPHARPMDFAGRPMRGYVYVAPEGIAEDAALAEWVRLSLAFVSTLPPKAPKPARKPAAAKAKAPASRAKPAAAAKPGKRRA